MSPRHIRSDTELCSAAGIINYEIEMLIFSGEHLDGWHSSPKAKPRDAEKNMALESFLLHFRNLRGFLCPSLQRLKSDDVIASDFFGEPSARDVITPSSLALEKDRIDKMLAHLSYERIRYIIAGNDQWPVPEIMELMLAHLESFLTSLSPAKRNWFLPSERIARSKSNAVLSSSSASTTATGSVGLPPPIIGPQRP